MVSDDSLRRAGLMRYADPSDTMVALHEAMQDVLGVGPDHILTKADIQKLRDSGRFPETTIKAVENYRGIPIKWVGFDSDPGIADDVPNPLKLAYRMAQLVGKTVNEKFTEADLKTIGDRFGWSEGQRNFWRPFLGKTYAEVTGALGRELVDTLVGGAFGLPNQTWAPGFTNPLDALIGVGRFIADPSNWVAVIGLLVGGGLVVFGGMRWLRGGS